MKSLAFSVKFYMAAISVISLLYCIGRLNGFSGLFGRFVLTMYVSLTRYEPDSAVGINRNLQKLCP